MNSSLETANEHALLVAASGEPIITISRAGDIFWKGREVQTDDDFKAAMRDLAKHLCAVP